MKQCITRQEWEDFTEYVEFNNFFQKFVSRDDPHVFIDGKLLFFPNIGQMISFLGEDLDKIMRTKRGYTVTMHWKCANYAGNTELVNALWKHVKSKLNNS